MHNTIFCPNLLKIIVLICWQTSVFDKRSRYLYEIIHSRPENADIEFKSCDSEPLKLPDFRTHGLRISDVSEYYNSTSFTRVLSF